MPLINNYDEVQKVVDALAIRLQARGWMLATAESCTGGLIAACCTSVAGSSDWFEGGYVTYSNGAKQKQLGVEGSLIEQHGAVSGPVALAMADGALAASGADVAVAVTGIAGPGGGSDDKPVGTVWVAWATRDGEQDSEGRLSRLQLPGNRTAIRSATALQALDGVLRLANGRTAAAAPPPPPASDTEVTE